MHFREISLFITPLMRTKMFALSGFVFMGLSGLTGCSSDNGSNNPSHTVIATSSRYGSITPAGEQTVQHGATISYTLIPQADASIDTVSGCGGHLTGNTYTTAAITQACIVQASFALSAPSGIEATGGDQQVELTWTEITGANGYCVYTSNAENITPATAASYQTRECGITTPAYTATGLTNNTTYYFVLTTVDADNQESAASDEVSVALITQTPTLLNDTGITTGFDFTNNVIGGCSVDAIDQQDCSHGRDAQTLTKTGDGAAGFDFTRLNADGTEYTGSGDYSSNPWACVKDNHTGLIWEVKTPAGNGDIHAADNTYRWGGKTALLTADYGARYDDWNSLVDGSNNNNLCGFNNWRVPNINELTSIVHLGKSDGTAAIDTDFFPNTAINKYWSASPLADIYNAWMFDFDFNLDDEVYRFLSDRRLRTNRLGLRLVSNGQ